MNREIVYGPSVQHVGQIPTIKNVYIGDFPPFDLLPVNPYQPVLPQILIPQTLITTWGVPFQNTWRIDKSKQDRISLSIDLPGVKENDLNVEIDSGILNLTAKRFDTNQSIKQTYMLGLTFDPNTASAALESGVLTIVVLKRKEHLPRKIKIETR